MISTILTRTLWGRILPLASVAGILLFFVQCEENPIISHFPGSAWDLYAETVDTLADTVLYRPPSHGGSRTLYAGLTQELSPRESGILIKFANVDTSLFNDLLSVELILIRRTFSEETPDPAATLGLYVIEAPDTIWSESDRGLTINDFLNMTTWHSSTALNQDTVTVFPGGLATDSLLEHAAFPVDSSLLRQWVSGSKANNGFLIKREDQGALLGFYSRNHAILFPYLAIEYADTTKEDSISNLYYSPVEDLSIYPVSESILPGQPVADPADGSLYLDHSNGLRVHFNFGPSLTPDTTSIVVAAHLVFYVNEEQYGTGGIPQPLAGQFELEVLRRIIPLVEGDSTESLIYQLGYSVGADSLLINVSSFVSALEVGIVENYGLDLVVRPIYHDFDRLILWGSGAPAPLRPRLDIVHGKPYQELP